MVHWPIDTNPAPPAGTPEDEIPDVKSAFETLIELQKEGLCNAAKFVSDEHRPY